MPAEDAALRTRRSFGLLWRDTAEGRVTQPAATHVERAARALDFQLPRRAQRILDAGCGPGADLRALAELHPNTDVVGLDANEAIAVAADAVAACPNAYVVRGSVLAPPFRAQAFDVVYSYGVLHHTDDPPAGFAALAELVAPGGHVLVYVYTDLADEPLLQAAVRLVTAARRVTTRLPPRAVMRLARIGSPLVFLLFGVPAAVLRRLPGGRRRAGRLPFNFVRSPTDAIGDLFDRLSAPIEFRHSRSEVVQWYRSAGLVDVSVTSMYDARGWVALGRRPLSEP